MNSTTNLPQYQFEIDISSFTDSPPIPYFTNNPSASSIPYEPLFSDEGFDFTVDQSSTQMVADDFVYDPNDADDREVDSPMTQANDLNCRQVVGVGQLFSQMVSNEQQFKGNVPSTLFEPNPQWVWPAVSHVYKPEIFNEEQLKGNVPLTLLDPSPQRIAFTNEIKILCKLADKFFYSLNARFVRNKHPLLLTILLVESCKNFILPSFELNILDVRLFYKVSAKYFNQLNSDWTALPKIKKLVKSIKFEELINHLNEDSLLVSHFDALFAKDAIPRAHQKVLQKLVAPSLSKPPIRPAECSEPFREISGFSGPSQEAIVCYLANKNLFDQKFGPGAFEHTRQYLEQNPR